MGSASVADLVSAPSIMKKKQRELYVGNLPIGQVSAQMLGELFAARLAVLPLPTPSATGPVIGVKLNDDGKFGFVEFASEELADVAERLFHKTELCGRLINVGRPRGYIPPATARNSLTALGATSLVAPNAPVAGAGGAAAAPTGGAAEPSGRCLCLTGLITSSMLSDDEYADVLDDIRQECERSGRVLDVVIPRQGPRKGACFVRYVEPADAARARASLHTRQFDGNTVTAQFVPEESF